MTNPPPSPTRQLSDRTTARAPLSWITALVLVVLMGVLILVALRLLLAEAEPARQSPEASAVEPRTFTPPVRAARTEVPAAAPILDEGSEPAPMPPAQSAPAAAEGPVGVHAFPPLGTRPKLSGIVVPEDFELPPGYVRHFQTSDDGEPLSPILMFDPGRPPLDSTGRPIDIPADRIVPPELAPPGLPIEILELPEPREPASNELRRLLRSG